MFHSTPWCNSSLPQVFHYPSLGLLKVIPVVPLLLTSVALCHHSFSIITHLDVTARFKFSQYSSIGWLCVIPGISLYLPEVALCHLMGHDGSQWGSLYSFMCPNITPWECSMSFQVSYCHSLGCFCVLPTVPLPLTAVDHVFSDILVQLKGVALHLLSIQLPLSGVILCPFTCPSTVYWCDSTLSQMSHCLSMRWLISSSVFPCGSLYWPHVISGVPLWLTLVAQTCPRYPTATKRSSIDHTM